MHCEILNCMYRLQQTDTSLLKMIGGVSWVWIFYGPPRQSFDLLILFFFLAAYFFSYGLPLGRLVQSNHPSMYEPLLFLFFVNECFSSSKLYYEPRNKFPFSPFLMKYKTGQDDNSDIYLISGLLTRRAYVV